MELINILTELRNSYPIFSSELLITRYKLTPQEAKEFILELKRKNLLGLIYRIRTEARFLDYDNDWTPHLQNLCKIFKTTHGEFIDGSEISNIDFRFKLLDSSLT